MTKENISPNASSQKENSGSIPDSNVHEQPDITMLHRDMVQDVEYNNPLFQCFSSISYYDSQHIYHIPEHWHEDLEFLYILNGSLDFTVNGQTIHLHAGEGIMVNSKRIHSNHSEKGQYCEFYVALLHPQYYNVSTYVYQKYVAPALSANAFDYLFLTKDNWTGEIIDNMVNLFEKKVSPNTELEILEVAFRILRTIHENVDFSASKEEPSHQYTKTFKEMMLYIQEHYMEKVSLDDIANAGNVGKTLCAKIFRRFSSKTPGEYLVHYRITRSIDLLRNTDMSITEIAYSTGFASASHYTKTFREIMGYTPNQYRRVSYTKA